MGAVTQIRPGSAADMDAAANIWQAAHAKRLGYIPEGARKARAMCVLHERIGLSGAQFLVAEQTGKVAGMLLACQARENDGAGALIPGLLHISYVATHPEFWGHGVASALLEAIALTAAESGAEALQLWVVTNNTRARSLYERHGFRFTGREKIDDYGEPIAHYRRAL